MMMVNLRREPRLAVARAFQIRRRRVADQCFSKIPILSCFLSLILGSVHAWSAWGDNLTSTSTVLNYEVSHRVLADVISQELQTDRDILLQWKQHWLSYPAQNPNASLYLSTWSEKDPSPCSWPGIVCASGPPAGLSRVTAVNISAIGLSGPLPVDGYADLTACTTLFFSNNQINGTIPKEIGNMPSLQTLDLSLNLLQGGIPQEFGNLTTTLVILNMSINSISGEIPRSLFSGCDSLVALNLSINVITGTLPSFAACQKLQYVHLWKNNITGTIPSELGALPNLEVLVLSENYLGGSIPVGLFSSCKSLRWLQLARMALTGSIPKEVANCQRLMLFNVQSNNITGSIPPEIGNVTQLFLFAAGNNSITGSLPDTLGSLANLQVLDLSLNQITGSIPPSFSNLQSLEYLTLQENALTGTVPTVVISLEKLRLLDLSNNQLVGSIPPELGQRLSLQFLFLASNNLSGSIPAELGALENLQVLDLSFNLLEESIPPTLGALKHLLWLQLSDNMLSGIIPPELGNCSSLIWLNLRVNELTGSIPESFDRIGNRVAETFQLNRDTLALVNAELGECGALERWLPGNFEPYSFLVEDLAKQGRRCRTYWNLLVKGQLHPAELESPLAFIQLSYNKLTGSMPRNLGVGGKFSIFVFDHNKLEGSMPDIFDQLPLYHINVSHNLINGSIPESLGFSPNLLSVDLSYNDISGPIPASLGNLTFITKFNVSYNNLSGPVPLSNQFATFSFTAYYGNPYLCYNGIPSGSTTLKSRILLRCSDSATIPPDVSDSETGSKLSPGTILGITLGCTFFVLMAAVFVCFASSGSRHRRGQANETDSPFKKVGRDRFHSSRDLLKIPISSFGTDSLPKALAYVDLLVATNNFDDSNIIGDGGFGVVYKAKLKDGNMVAVKKLIQDGAQGEREFAAEMLTLGNIRHANLVPLLGYCAFEGEKLLVYKCMTNGSLEEWLHDRPGGKEVLGWAKRLNIAAGAARGLDFLHHSCAPVIIHRDMKASNILLDDNFCAYVTDFGLARRMYGFDTHVSTIVAGTLGYVPPEYSQTWRSTTKGDVYSFGVVLLELLTGRRPTGSDFDNDTSTFLSGNVVEWVRILLAKRRNEDAYDPVIKNAGASQELFQFLKLAVACTDDVPSNRPAMSDVSTALEQILLAHSKRSPSQAFL